MFHIFPGDSMFLCLQPTLQYTESRSQMTRKSHTTLLNVLTTSLTLCIFYIVWPFFSRNNTGKAFWSDKPGSTTMNVPHHSQSFGIEKAPSVGIGSYRRHRHEHAINRRSKDNHNEALMAAKMGPSDRYTSAEEKQATVQARSAQDGETQSGVDTTPPPKVPDVDQIDPSIFSHVA